MLNPKLPALVLAPMDGITDAPMRAFLGASGAFSYAVSEFVRVSVEPLPAKVFRREIPEICTGGRTETRMPVQVQILGGDPERMAISAVNACKAGATSIDINFGCPAPTVNRHDGGASLLRYPCRVRDVVSAVRDAVPAEVSVSAKLRLGWESIDEIYENATMAAEGGAAWLTIHARTKMQGYAPPVYYEPIGKVRESLGIPVVANGDIWSLDDFKRCQDMTGCLHFMIGRSALANPSLPHQIAVELGIAGPRSVVFAEQEPDWISLFGVFLEFTEKYCGAAPKRELSRLKQWLKLASSYGSFRHFDTVKYSQTLEELFEQLRAVDCASESEPLLAVV
ncbi:MAG: tRNA-dihydrouridine synthase family protein [Fimbriimonadaceae bacterium]|nr:tRNA-dihydrouridine synthase family protein [Fimbriimonadaceae bacterium]